MKFDTQESNNPDNSIGRRWIIKEGMDYIVRVPIKVGGVTVTFSEISRAAQSFSTVLSLQLIDIQEGTSLPFTQRIDINSASAMETLRRNLDNAFGKAHNWTLVLNQACSTLREEYIKEQKVRWMTGRAPEPTKFLFPPFLQTNAANMVFGDSEVGKSWFTLRMAASLAIGENFLGFQCEGGKKTLYIDYEDDDSAFNFRLHHIAQGMGVSKDHLAPSIAWFKPDGSMRDLRDVISRFVTDNKFDLIIIDAGSNAVGGSPNDEQKVVEMFNSIEHIPCTKLIIHHEPKSVVGTSDNNAFYGTTYWRALVRVSWRLVLENKDNGKLIKAIPTKMSNAISPEGFMYRQTWGWPEEGNDPNPFDLSKTYFERVDGPIEKSTKERIIECLKEHGKLSRLQIADMIGISNDGVKKSLQRMKDDELINCEGKANRALWFLLSKVQVGDM